MTPTEARARPNADLVIVWAPGAQLAPVEQAAQQVGAAVIDRSPPASARLATSALIKRGIAAFDALKLAEATQLLDEARALADQTGAAEPTQTELSDLCTTSHEPPP